MWAETLRILLDRLHTHARSGHSVVVDDTQCYRRLRDRYRSECIASGLEPTLLLVSAPQHVLYARHAHAASSGSREVLSLERLADHLARFERPGEDEHATDVSSAEALDAYLRVVQEAKVRRDA